VAAAGVQWHRVLRCDPALPDIERKKAFGPPVAGIVTLMELIAFLRGRKPGC
jgi:hypothetical protein